MYPPAAYGNAGFTLINRLHAMTAVARKSGPRVSKSGKLPAKGFNLREWQNTVARAGKNAALRKISSAAVRKKKKMPHAPLLTPHAADRSRLWAGAAGCSVVVIRAAI